MDFKPNKTPAEIIKEASFGGTYFRDFHSGVNNKWYKNSWKEFKDLESIDPKYYCSDFYDVNLNKYVLKKKFMTFFLYLDLNVLINSLKPLVIDII